MGTYMEIFNAMDGNLRMSQRHKLLKAFEAEIRKGIAADIRAAAPKHLDNDVDVHVWHVLDDLAGKVEHPDKDGS